MAAKELLIGIADAGVMHTDPAEFDIDTRFRMVREAGVFDYYDKTPPVQELHLYKAAVQKHGLRAVAQGDLAGNPGRGCGDGGGGGSLKY